MSAAATAARQRDPGPQPRATYQDVLDAPPHRVAEIVDGVLHTNPRPAMPHARASSSLGVKIGGPFDYDYPDAAYCTLAPDWVCEVLSPSTRKLDLHGKRPVYDRDRAGRRPGPCPPLRGGHLQPRRPVALSGRG
jgi:hypothetical protein